jgi:hypothetical protein
MPETIIVPATTLPPPYEELQGSPTENYTKEGFTANRTFKVPWSARGAFVLALKGRQRRIGTAIEYTLPQQYPTHSTAYVVAASIKPWGTDPKVLDGGGGVQASYDYAEISVEYNTDWFKSFSLTGMEGEPFVSETLAPYSEYISIPADGRVGWGVKRPITDAEIPGIVFHGMEWTYRRHRLPDLPQELFTLVETPVNAAEMRSLKYGFTFPAETLLYKPPVVEIETDSEGNTTYSAELRFFYKPTGWNKFFRSQEASAQKLYKLSHTGAVLGEFKPYTPGNLLALAGVV